MLYIYLTIFALFYFRGHCDHSTGRCACADGFTGVACERNVCPGYNPNTGTSFKRSIFFFFLCITFKKGGYCSDGGWCMNVREMYSLYGYTYGAEFDQVTYTHPVSRAVPSGWNTAYRQGKSE
jgi:hypothetical protein